MSTIKVNAIQHTTANASNMTLFANGNVAMTTANTTLTVGNTTISNSGISVAGAAINPFGTGMRNRIINGDMRIDQRNAGASANNAAATVFSVDRWQTFGTQATKFSLQQNAGSVTPPTGFTYYLGITSLSSYSLGVNDFNYVAQTIEGYNAADFAWGSADAKTVTLSFWVRSSLTGTFGGSVYQSGARNYPFSYTISSANTWTYVTITIPGDTSATGYNKTNGTYFYLIFGLGTGATYSSGAAGSWSNSNNIQASGTVSVVGTAGATWYITGVQVELGSVATPFEFRHYGQELALCQRYYYLSNPSNTYRCGGLWGCCYSSTNAALTGSFPVTMRVAPTVSFGGSANTMYINGVNAASSYGAQNIVTTVNVINLETLSMTSSGVGYPVEYNGQLSLSAEL
jgi:hypothetical protein